MAVWLLTLFGIDAYVVYRTRTRHDREYRSGRLIWWNASPIVTAFSREGSGPVRKLAFAQSLFAIVLTPIFIGLAINLDHLPRELALPAALVVATSPAIVFGPTLFDWYLGWLWHRREHAAHRQLLEAWTSAIDSLSDEQLCRLGEVFGRDPALVALADPSAPMTTFTDADLKIDLDRVGRRPLTTFERRDIEQLGMTIASARMTARGVRKRYLADHVVWMNVSWQLGPELARGLESAWLISWAVLARDQLRPATFETAVAPWRDVVGAIPGLDPAT